ncbi:MAG: LytTR family DNA-binding domain-containing protein [Lachnospiraceae bacterium]|nr:LytTR family DNA-binding domain-containing protein [Lachnospiraceae bacterium]
MAYHIAVCDDSPIDLQYDIRLIEQWADERQTTVRIESFPSAESFLFRYAEEKDFDILLLDIEMGAMDGVTLARQIRRENQAVQIIFVTGYSDYIAEGYEVEALHYLMKPLNQEKLFQVLDRAVEKCRQTGRSLILDISGEMVRIPFYEIRYLEVHQNYVTVCAREEYTVRRTLSDFEKELDESFLRVGRAYIINLNQVRRVTKKEVILADGTALPLPRGAYEGLNRAIIDLT